MADGDREGKVKIYQTAYRVGRAKKSWAHFIFYSQSLALSKEQMNFSRDSAFCPIASSLAYTSCAISRTKLIRCSLQGILLILYVINIHFWLPG